MSVGDDRWCWRSRPVGPPGLRPMLDLEFTSRFRRVGNNRVVRWVGLVLLLGLVARLAGQVVLGAYVQPQVFEYEEVASNLLAGRGYMYQPPDGGYYLASQSSPLYVFVTASVYLVTNHSQTAMLLLQAGLGGVTAALVTWLGGRVFSRAGGVAAGALVAGLPGGGGFGGPMDPLPP